MKRPTNGAGNGASRRRNAEAFATVDSSKGVRSRRSLCLVFAATFAALVFAGCGGSADGRLGISGEVNFQGAPLDRGTIQFAAADGSAMTGGDIVDGVFDIPADRGAKPGAYVVRISSVDAAPAPVEAMPGDAAPAPPNPERIPANWNAQSDQTREITEAGENRFTFDIP